MTDRMDGPAAADLAAERPPERWERAAGPLLASLPYALLTICTAFTVPTRDDLPVDLLVVVGLAALTGAWTAGWVTLNPQLVRRERLMAGVFAGWLLLAGGLVLCAPWFGFYAFTGYLFAGVMLTRRAQAVAVACVAVIVATSQNGGLPDASATHVLIYLVLVAINVGIASYFMGDERRSEAQDELRRDALRELAATNDRLERSLRTNAELQEQLLERAREAGRLAERQRMAGEIHDTLAQDLVAIITQLEALEQARSAAAGGDRLAAEEVGHRAATAGQLAREALGEARRSVQALRPTPLDAARLPDALAQVAARWSQVHGIDAAFAAHGNARPLRPELEVAMLRTAQEALANVARHAGAHRVGLTLSYMDDVVTLDIRDDGNGFEPAQLPAAEAVEVIDGGFGLLAMRERIHAVRGTLAIESEPGAGTALSASVPALTVAG